MKRKPTVFAAMDCINHDAELDKSERNILRTMLKYANKDTGECWPAVATLARDSGMSVRGVQGVLRRLEDKGRLIVLFRSRGGNRRATGRGIPNHWRLNLFAPVSIAQSQDARNHAQNPAEGTENPADGARNPAWCSPNPAADDGEPGSGCGERAFELSIHQPRKRAIQQPCGDGSLSQMANGMAPTTVERHNGGDALRTELAKCGVTGRWLHTLALSNLTVEDVRREWVAIQYRADVRHKPAMLVHRLKVMSGIDTPISGSSGYSRAGVLATLQAIRESGRYGPSSS